MLFESPPTSELSVDENYERADEELLHNLHPKRECLRREKGSDLPAATASRRNSIAALEGGGEPSGAAPQSISSRRAAEP